MDAVTFVPFDSLPLHDHLNLTGDLRNELEKARANGLPENLYQGFLAGDPAETPGLAQELGADVRGQPQPGRDAGRSLDPAIAERQAQQTDLKAASPLQSTVEQHGTMGLGLFDVADQPTFRLSEEGDAKPIHEIMQEAEADELAAKALDVEKVTTSVDSLGRRQPARNCRTEIGGRLSVGRGGSGCEAKWRKRDSKLTHSLPISATTTEKLAKGPSIAIANRPAQTDISPGHAAARGERSQIMDWDVIASSRIDDLTKPRSTGRPTNTHVVPSRQESKPDFERMRDLVHQKEPAPAAKAA